ncbi:hypothetical protein [Methylovulum psychrotolerans]|jgi:hypothetical protein|uniref:Uncharacterized protein n=1 Tax=Methylovulum psychrotolerans TaxID=1704499 RepID=A0A2S5CNH8_9GAMM|nr:hypothetical protein [Methylovulum psychrotolerans]MBT9096201.1 hypothetical protein [Methylovulum psychrotolerans]POZ52326.1 hypothetical protein AADEFJLK_01807 [Methylovulum psychrotolerans]
MNLTQVKCLAVFAVFAVIGFGPISPGCLIGLSVVVLRPQWFLTLSQHLYANLPAAQVAYTDITPQQTQQARVKGFLSLLALFIIDIAPVPVTPVIAFAVIIIRPLRFYHWVLRVYGPR